MLVRQPCFTLPGRSYLAAATAPKRAVRDKPEADSRSASSPSDSVKTCPVKHDVQSLRQLSRGACPYLASLQGAGDSPVEVSVETLNASVAEHRDNPAEVLEELHEQGAVVRVNTEQGTLYFDHRPDTVQQALVATENRRRPPTFKKSPTQTHSLAEMIGRDNLLLENGEQWQASRSALLPYFRGRRLHNDQVVDRITAVADRHLDSLERRLGQSGESRVDLQPVLQRLTLDVALEQIFSYRADDAELEALQRSYEVALAGVGREFIRPENPSRHSAEQRESHRFLSDFATRIIASRKIQESPPDDALQGLLGATDPTTGQAFTDERLRQEVMTLMLAGHETTAALIHRTLVSLAHEPDRQAAVRAEISSEVSGIPTYKEVKALKEVGEAWKHAASVKPPTYLVAREAIADTKVGPKGAELELKEGDTLYMSLAHANQTELPSGRTRSFTFGGGARVCLGQILARLETETVVTRFLQRFEIEASGSPSSGSHFSSFPKGELLVRRLVPPADIGQPKA